MRCYHLSESWSFTDNLLIYNKLERMDNLLSNNSIANLLQQNGEMDVKISVISNTFKQAMTLIGFIPYNELDTLNFFKPQINMNSEVIFTPYRIKFPMFEVTYPIMKKIRLAKGEESLLIQRKLVTPYGVKGFIGYYHDVERVDYPEGKKKKVLEYKTKELLKQVKASPYYNPNRLSVNEDGLLVYNLTQEEFVSSRTYGRYTVISNCYLCLCAYTNSVTGLPCYSLFDPEDIYKVEDANKDE